MKKIACVGYHYTGSGAVDDLFRECDNVYQGKYEAEFRLLHDPDGISDLEYFLVENPNRLSSSLAIKRFLRYTNQSYRMTRHIIGKEWFSIVDKFVDNIIQIEHSGYNNGDKYFFTTFQKTVDFLCRGVNKILPKPLKMPKDSLLVPYTKTYYSKLTEEEFLNKVNIFIEELCQCINKEGKEYVVLDQFVSSSNPSRCLRYANDLKVIIVDRDPRDLYINRISKRDRILPSNPMDFAKYYRKIREFVGDVDDTNVLRINLEDMIYNYDDSIRRIFDFVKMDSSHHVTPKKYFNPDVSITGTQTWKSHPEYAEAVKIIEQELPDFLYPYNNKIESC